MGTCLGGLTAGMLYMGMYMTEWTSEKDAKQGNECALCDEEEHERRLLEANE